MSEALAPFSDIVLLTTVSLARNFADRPFDSIMSDDDARANVDCVDSALTASGHRSEFNRIALNDMTPAERRWLLDRGQITDEMFKRTSRGAAFIAKGNTISVMVNEADHVRIQGMLPGLQVERCAELCGMAQQWLDSDGLFAFDDQFGYLTVDPLKAGSGLSFSVILHLRMMGVSGLVKRKKKELEEKGLTIAPIAEGKDEPFDALYRLSGAAALTQTGEDALSDFETTATRLVNEERALRQRFMAEEPLIARDRAARALALVEAALLMNESEMRLRYSELRCAVRDKLLLVPFEALDQLRLSLMNASLDLRTGAMLTERKRDEMRANEFRQGLHKLIRDQQIN